MIDRKSVDINVVKNKTIPWMSCVCEIFIHKPISQTKNIIYCRK